MATSSKQISYGHTLKEYLIYMSSLLIYVDKFRYFTLLNTETAARPLRVRDLCLYQWNAICSYYLYVYAS